MRNINESFKNTQSLSSYISDKMDTRVDEGFKELMANLKSKFQKVVQYLRNAVVKIGSYFIPTNDNGDLLAAISPLTAGQAYNDGLINKSNTCVILDNKASKIVKSGSYSDVKSLYGSGNSLDYWRKTIKESIAKMKANINEVKLSPSDSQARNIIDFQG